MKFEKIQCMITCQAVQRLLERWWGVSISTCERESALTSKYRLLLLSMQLTTEITNLKILFLISKPIRELPRYSCCMSVLSLLQKVKY